MQVHTHIYAPTFDANMFLLTLTYAPMHADSSEIHFYAKLIVTIILIKMCTHTELCTVPAPRMPGYSYMHMSWYSAMNMWATSWSLAMYVWLCVCVVGLSGCVCSRKLCLRILIELIIQSFCTQCNILHSPLMRKCKYTSNSLLLRSSCTHSRNYIILHHIIVGLIKIACICHV